MGDGDLPISGGLLEALFHPLLLLTPNLPHEVKAVLRRSWAAVACAVRIGWVVLLAADVVGLVDVRRVGIHRVGVEHEDLNAEVLVWELHALLEVLPGHDPAVTLPGVGDLLVPGIVELPAPVVVVAKHAQPRLPVEARAGVDLLEDVVEHLLREAGHLVHRAATILGDAPPIEVVSDVEDSLWIALRCTCPHLLRDQGLRPVVYSLLVATLWIARRLAVGGKALSHLVVRLARMRAVAKGVWAGCVPTPILNQLTMARPHSGHPIEAAPVANSEKVHLFMPMMNHCRPSNSIEACDVVFGGWIAGLWRRQRA
mmetsp:Transcript_97626/g.284990  ORF Transcript_97626/g.284990 Transcript_97626/m.284990 type:complete len:313 (+) Transcript_97626:119-1057(+)